MIRLVAILALLSACAPATAPEQAADPALRPLGSTSLCADSYLIELAPKRIAALSWQAGSPLSTASKPMTDLPRLWNSREILARTDLALLSGPGDATFGRHDTLSLQWGEDFETVRTNAQKLNQELEIDTSELERALDALDTLPRPERPPRVLYLSRSGGSAGPGTFVDAVIRKAGAVNLNDVPGWNTPSVERLLQYDPDLVVTSFFGSDYAGANDRAVRNSALRQWLSGQQRLDIPGKLWPCAGPGLIEATRRLNAALTGS